MFPQYVPPNDTSVRFGAFLKQSLATGPEYVNDVRFIEEISKNSTLWQRDISKYFSFGNAAEIFTPTRHGELLTHTISRKGQLEEMTQVLPQSHLRSST